MCLALVWHAGRLAVEHISPFLLSHEWGVRTKHIDSSLRVAPDHGPPSARDKTKTVGWHPHRGFDLITYVKEGRGSHADSLGNVAVVRPGGVQWMRSGSGIEHAGTGLLTRHQHRLCTPGLQGPPSFLPLISAAFLAQSCCLERALSGETSCPSACLPAHRRTVAVIGYSIICLA
jgi:hypothetical protein